MWLVLALSIAFGAEHPDFTGSWVLDAAASDSADALLAAWGVPWVQRQAVKAMSPTQTITVEGDTLTLVIDVTVLVRTETLKLDGSPQVSTTLSGAPATTRSGWEGATLVSRTESVRSDGQMVTLVASRTLEQEGAVMRQRLELVQADGVVLKADRVFRKR